MALTSSPYSQTRRWNQQSFGDPASMDLDPTANPNARRSAYNPNAGFQQPQFTNEPWSGYDYGVGPGGGQSEFSPDLTTEDPARMAVQDRTFGYDRGNRIDYDLANRGQYYDQSQERYRVPMEQSYQDLYNTPGYTEQEAQDIRNQGNMPTRLSQEQTDAMQYTPEEMAGIRGDPAKQYGWYNPAQTEGIANETAGGMRNALDSWQNAGRNAWSGMSENTRAAIGRANLAPGADYTGMQDKYLDTDLGPTADYTGAQDKYLGQGAANIRRAIDNPELEMDPAYAQAMRGAMAGGERGVRGYTEDPNLLASDEYMANMQFGPEDQQDMITGAATTVGATTRAERDRVERAAAAAGGTSPLALAAAEEELQRGGDINAFDAMLNAKIAAKQLGLQTLQQREGTRLGAEQNRGALGANSELSLYGNRLGGTQNIENTRLNALQSRGGLQLTGEQGIMGAGLGAAGERQGYQQTGATNKMNAGLGAANAREGYRSNAENARMNADLSNEQMLGTSLLGQEGQYGQAGINAAYQGGQMRQNANQYNQNTGIDVERSVDALGSQRASELAGNRQAVTQYGQGTGFNQGMTVNNAESARAAQVAGARQAGQSDFRNWATGQTQFGGQQGTAQRTARNQAFGTQGDVANTATRNALTYHVQNPSFGRTFTQQFGGALGKGLGEGLSGGFYNPTKKQKD